jgi:hypothetical protein
MMMNKLMLVLFSIMPLLSFSQDEQISKLNSFIEEWHKNAAEADTTYFDKIGENGIYIGTDASEYWTKDEFVTWSRKYFENGKAWSFSTIERNIYTEGNVVWFDELLNTGMGVCRASGVIKIDDDKFIILHYHLSIAIPNEDVKQIKKIIEDN